MTLHVADARERQVERPRDRRRGEGQDVDLALELLQPLLGRDAEALLLVDDHQPEVLEPDVLRQQPMRADDEVDRAVGETREVFSCSAFGTNRERSATLTGNGPNRAPNVARCWAARTVVGHEHGDLLAVLGGLERGPDRDLGLAVADVADDQPVHRPDRLHVVLDLDDGAQLVDGLLVRERGLHLGLPGRVAG